MTRFLGRLTKPSIISPGGYHESPRVGPRVACLDAARISKSASMIGQSGMRRPVHFAAVSDITRSRRRRSAILRRVFARCCRVKARICAQV